MIKQFSAGDITIRPFNAFKNWTVQSIDSSSLDRYGYPTYYANFCEINEGRKITSSFYPSGNIYYTSSLEPINSSGKYARNIYSLTDSMFYRGKNNPFELFGVEKYVTDKVSGKKEVRTIHDRVVTLALNHNAFGDKIIPNTINVTDNSNFHSTYLIKDDGYSNLYISGSHFSTYTHLGGVNNIYARPYWNTSSGQFYVTYSDGISQSIDLTTAQEYASIGMNVKYVGTPIIEFDNSLVTHSFQSESEHFGESISSWYKYIAVGSSVDETNIFRPGRGYAALFKYDENTRKHRILKRFDSPFSVNGFVQDFDINTTFNFSPSAIVTPQQIIASSSYFTDTFGHSVSVKDDFLAIGSPSGSICFPTGSYPGFVFVYDRHKGGDDNWGLINIIQGGTNDDKFGNSVSLYGDFLAIGAPNVSGSGAVYIFRRKRYLSSGCDNILTSSFWQTVYPEISSSCDVMESESGSYEIYSETEPTLLMWSGSYTWVHETTLTSSILSTGDRFGWTVSIDSSSLIVGTNKSGNGYAAIFTCSYYSASLNACPTASWSEQKILRRDNSYGDLDLSSGAYVNDVSSTHITTDGFGKSVSLSWPSAIVGCIRDKAFVPYSSYSGSPNVLGAAYFYKYESQCETASFYKIGKTFGDRQYTTNNKFFGSAVSIGGNLAAVSSWSDKIGRSVDFQSGQYVIEDHAYAATSSEDSNGVLGRVSVYSYDDVNSSWNIKNTIKRNKESYSPANVYGYSVCICSDFLSVGAPVVNLAVPSATASIYDPVNFKLFPENYSGSVFVYNFNNYEENPLIGNVFYKNGYVVLTNTSSNYHDIFYKTGSRGFELSYQGSHTIYEHEHLISIRPGEFNYSTNPTSLIKYNLTFDVNRDGVFDIKDVDLIMRYLQNKKFFDEYIFDDNGFVLEQDSLNDYSWWNNDILQTESEDVLLHESIEAAYFASASFDAFTKSVFDYIKTNLVSTGLLDIDGNGKINMDDGYILSLYYLNRLLPETLERLIDKNSTRIYVKDIKEYLNAYCRVDNNKVNPHFFEYQYSSSYDPTGSYLSPFITTIGLYQDNELVAIGKLGRPLKNLVDWPVNIVVRFDT